MRIGIVGAGIAGLVTAKVLKQAGCDVVIFDKAPDVGGVWSRTRRYPGLTTQSPKTQYSFSDFPMPDDYPEWPTGEQIQAYLASYAHTFGLEGDLRLNTEVTAARRLEGKWALDTGSATEIFDRLVIANGVFCDPAIPEFPGREAFAESGGTVCAATAFNDVEQARDKHVVIVGYGKTACDVTVAISSVAASTDIVARQLLWKIPRKIGGIVNFKALLLTRLGEALFRYRYLRGFERFLHGPANPVRRRMLNSLGTISIWQYGLRKLALVPSGGMEDIIKGAIGLGTEGFFENVRAGKIVVHRDCTIERVLAHDGEPFVELSNGELLPAQMIVCATGFTQSVPLFAPEVQRSLCDARNNFMLYRQILPLDVPGLYFNGYNSSLFSPLNAEMAAVWIAAHLGGVLTLPDTETQRQSVVDQLAFMDVAMGAHHCRGTKIIPFSLHNVDELLADLDLNIKASVRAWHWLTPVDPAAYRKVTPALLERLSGGPGSIPLELALGGRP